MALAISRGDNHSCRSSSLSAGRLLLWRDGASGCSVSGSVSRGAPLLGRAGPRAPLDTLPGRSCEPAFDSPGSPLFFTGAGRAAPTSLGLEGDCHEISPCGRAPSAATWCGESVAPAIHVTVVDTASAIPIDGMALRTGYLRYRMDQRWRKDARWRAVARGRADKRGLLIQRQGNPRSPLECGRGHGAATHPSPPSGAVRAMAACSAGLSSAAGGVRPSHHSPRGSRTQDRLGDRATRDVFRRKLMAKPRGT